MSGNLTENVYAQDILGGEIRHHRLAENVIDFNIFMDTRTSIGINHQTVIFHAGDGDQDTLNGTSLQLAGDITEWNYGEVKTYRGDGAYLAYLLDSFRLAGINNILNSSSESMGQEDAIVISPFVNDTNGVEFLNPLYSFSQVNNMIVYDPSAAVTGDSIVYSLTRSSAGQYSFPAGAVIDSQTGIFQMPVMTG